MTARTVSRVARRDPPPAPRKAPARRRARFDERDRKIREVAQRLLLERGLHGFSMDDVADAIDYSKGTVYQHYRSKEDALLGCCAVNGAELASRLERAAARPGRPRERMVAVGEAYSSFLRENLAQFRTIPLMHAPTVHEKASAKVLRAVQGAQGRCVDACASVVRDAVACGDLRVPKGWRVETITFALWSAMFGAYMLVELKRPQGGVLGIHDPADTVRRTWSVAMDGLGWRPTSREVDAGAASRRGRAPRASREGKHA